MTGVQTCALPISSITTETHNMRGSTLLGLAYARPGSCLLTEGIRPNLLKRCVFCISGWPEQHPLFRIGAQRCISKSERLEPLSAGGGSLCEASLFYFSSSTLFPYQLVIPNSIYLIYYIFAQMLTELLGNFLHWSIAAPSAKVRFPAGISA